MLKFIVCVFILVILLRILSNKLNNLADYIEKAIRKKSEENEKNRKIEEEKRIKVKWVNDLRSGKKVEIGFQTIQCKNDIFIIGEESFSVNEIQKLDFTSCIVNVKKHTQYCEADSEYRDNLYRHSTGEVSMTYKQYLEEVERERKYPKASRKNILVHYEFTEEYYILIILNSGKKKQYVLDYSTDPFGKKSENCSSMVLELGKYINELKVKASTIYL